MGKHRDGQFRVAGPDHVDDVPSVLDCARQHDRDALRLDCVAASDRLRAYYERAGFVYRGDAAVGGAPGQRLDAGPATWVSRYEMSLVRRSEPLR